MKIVRRQLSADHRMSRRSMVSASTAAALVAGMAGTGAVARQATPGADASPASGARPAIVDLSHTMTPEMPVWPGNESFRAEAIKTFDRDGFYAQQLTFWEHTGTHLDAPAHFHEGADTAELIPVETLFAPIVVIDIAARASEDPDTAVTVDDLVAFEAEFGKIPAGAFVAMYSGWGAMIDDPEAFINLDADGVQHYPGFHPDAAEFLVSERDIVGIGVDTLSQDPGNSADFGTHITILGAGKYGVEGVANLDQVASAGSSVFIGGPKHQDASGGPARVIALNRAR
jgi:kynurenine formamidase